ncbi:MAG: tetratricopeptide repeat protein [Planctomycetia bacterium]|nr:tetratricopeptide repeat protein [Planctomycetia bacterium]
MKASKTQPSRPAPRPSRTKLRGKAAREHRAWRPVLAGAVLVAAAVLAYAPALGAGFIWDDDFYVTHNPTLRSAEGLRRMWFQPFSLPQYYPLVHTTFWLEYHLWGLAPVGYHLVNVLLHATSAVLLWRLLARLKVPGAWLAAAIFAVHPVCVESVAWVTERKNALSLSLALASMLCYLRFAPLDDDTGQPAVPSPRPWAWYAASFVLFAAALFSKTVVLSMPAVMLVLCWWKRGRIAVSDVLPLAPFLAMGAALGATTAWMEKYHVGAAGADWDLSPADRVLIAGRALWFYAGKLAWPYPLAFFYPRFAIDSTAWWQYLFPAAALLVIVALWLARTRIGRGPLAAVLIFAGVLVPALGFFDVFPFRFSFVADHFQYHASVALMTLAAAAATVAYKKRAGRSPAPAALAAAALVLVALGGLTFRQAGVYHDLETLYRDTIAKNPGGWTAYSNLGVHLETLGRQEEAFEMARQAVHLNPREPSVHSNLGSLLVKMADRGSSPEEQLAEAEACYREALRLQPNFVPAINGLGSALLLDHKLEEAMEQFERALSIDSKDPFDRPRALCGIGVVMRERNRWAEAEDSFELALYYDPDDVAAHCGLGMVLRHQGRLDEAILHLQAAASLDPDFAEAQFELANVLAMKGQPQAAAHRYGEVLRVQPTHVRALHNLAVVLLQMGQTNRAIPYLRQAVRLKPDYAEANANLARALEAQAEERGK